MLHRRTSRAIAPPPGFSRLPMLAPPILAHAFQELDVGVSSWCSGVWRSLYFAQSVTTIEIEQGLSALRHRYNMRCLAETQASRKIVRGKLGGLIDLFVPIVHGNRVEAIVVTGPLASARPTSGEVLARWLQMTGSHGKITDPPFSRYLAATLRTLTLEGPLLPAFERMMSSFAQLLSGRGNPHALTAQFETIRERVLEARFADRMWEAARSMVDERTAHTWQTGLQRDPLARMGMRRPAKHVVVGLVIGRPDDDPLDALLRRAAFQRACVGLARRRRHVVCGQVGDRGITLLPDSAASGESARAELTDLARRAAEVGRRFRLAVHAGIALSEGGSLPLSYRAALAAAEKALSRSTSLELAQARVETSSHALRHIRANLSVGVEERPSHLSARFERYVAAVLAHTGYQVASARAHLQAGLERLAEPLLLGGALDPKSFDQICVGLEGARAPDSVSELLQAYRRVVTDIEHAIEAPTAARQEQSIRRALSFVHEHLAEPLGLPRVARIAGFAPGYFSKLLEQEEGLGFEQYVQKHRLERAKHLLAETTLSIGRIAQLSGFRSRTYFQALFKASTGRTPTEYRRVAP
jgi:AraC-like DNA-binding protein